MSSSFLSSHPQTTHSFACHFVLCLQFTQHDFDISFSTNCSFRIDILALKVVAYSLRLPKYFKVQHPFVYLVKTRENVLFLGRKTDWSNKKTITLFVSQEFWRFSHFTHQNSITFMPLKTKMLGTNDSYHFMNFCVFLAILLIKAIFLMNQLETKTELTSITHNIEMYFLVHRSGALIQ